MCRKHEDWREKLKKHFEHELIRLVLLEKDQLQINEDKEPEPDEVAQVNDIIKA